MDKTEIMLLLKKMRKQYEHEADVAIAKHDNNSENTATWYHGKASGILEAIGIIGMLNKNNKASKQNDQKTSKNISFKTN